MRIKHLKIKICSLAAESVIIRREEIKAKARGDVDTFRSLQAHRKFDVRNESRAAQLAYAYLRGKPYAVTESEGSAIPATIIVRAAEIVTKFDGGNGPKDRQAAKNIMFHWINSNKPGKTKDMDVLYAVGKM